MTHDPDARILSGPALAHVRSALMMAIEDFKRWEMPLAIKELQAALDSLNSGKPVEETLSQRQAREVMNPKSASAPQTQSGVAWNAVRERKPLSDAERRWREMMNGPSELFSDSDRADVTRQACGITDEYADGDIEPEKRETPSHVDDVWRYAVLPPKAVDAIMPEIRALQEEHLQRVEARARDSASHDAAMAQRHANYVRRLREGEG